VSICEPRPSHAIVNLFLERTEEEIFKLLEITVVTFRQSSRNMFRPAADRQLSGPLYRRTRLGSTIGILSHLRTKWTIVRTMHSVLVHVNCIYCKLANEASLNMHPVFVIASNIVLSRQAIPPFSVVREHGLR
jgi:hypothetical protein